MKEIMMLEIFSCLKDRKIHNKRNIILQFNVKYGIMTDGLKMIRKSSYETLTFNNTSYIPKYD